MRKKLNLITPGVDDFEKSLGFYEKLGWKNPGKIIHPGLFPRGGITLALYPRQQLAKEATRSHQASQFSELPLPAPGSK